MIEHIGIKATLKHVINTTSSEKMKDVIIDT